jgi:hypothetical protein
VYAVYSPCPFVSSFDERWDGVFIKSKAVPQYMHRNVCVAMMDRVAETPWLRGQIFVAF